MDHQCSKCSRWGMVWDGRAKVIMCLYHNCKHIIKLFGYDHHGIPSKGEVQAAIEEDMDMANEAPIIDLKYIRRTYYTSRARPETHELHINVKDSMRWLVIFHKVDLTGATLAQFIDDIKNGDGQPCFFKRILVKFFCDGPTQFVNTESEFVVMGVDIGKRELEEDTANMP